MLSGLGFAFSEWSLVLFTTLAPAGAVACCLMLVPVILGKLDDETSLRVQRTLALPIIVAMLGLIASATHLGTPDNALFVFAGVSRSPLSNEVASAVVFLMLGGIFWITAVRPKGSAMLRRIWATAICIAALCFVHFIGRAYAVETIPGWDIVYAPISIWCNALCAGPILALCGFCAAKVPLSKRCLTCALLLTGLAAVCTLIDYALWGFAAAGIADVYGTALSRTLCYPALVGAFALFSSAGVAVEAGFPNNWMAPASLRRSIAACTCLFIAIFIMRLAFYAMHVTTAL